VWIVGNTQARIRSVGCSRAKRVATDSGNRDTALAARTAEGAAGLPRPADLPRIGQDNEGIVMGFNKASTLLAAATAISTQVAAQAACDLRWGADGFLYASGQRTCGPALPTQSCAALARFLS
jgi:hypothetical protein